MTIGERLKHIRKEAGFSQVNFAAKINVSKQTLYKYENNIITNIPIDKIEAAAAAACVPPSYIMGWCDSAAESRPAENISPTEPKRLPILGEISCGIPKYANEDSESYVLSGTDIRADFCLRASGDSMIGSRILDGDIVFIRKQDIVENGKIAAVIIDDEAALKRFFYYKEQSLLILRPDNPAYEELQFTEKELDHVQVLGQAVAFQSEIK